MSTVPEETGATPELDRLMREQAKRLEEFDRLAAEFQRKKWIAMLKPGLFPRIKDEGFKFKFGLMLEKSNSPAWADCPWRFFSARIHGPMCPTRRQAFWEWLKNWWTVKRIARFNRGWTVDPA